MKDTLAALYSFMQMALAFSYELELDSWQPCLLCTQRKDGKEDDSHAATKCMMLISQIQESNVRR